MGILTDIKFDGVSLAGSTVTTAWSRRTFTCHRADGVQIAPGKLAGSHLYGPDKKNAKPVALVGQTLPVLVPGQYTLIVRVQKEPDADALRVPFGVAGVVSPEPPTPLPPVDPLPPKPPVSIKIASCFDYHLPAVVASRISKLGMAGVRCFGNGINEKGDAGAGEWNSIAWAKKFHAIAPDQLWIDLRTTSENKAGGAVVSEDGLNRWYENYAKLTDGLGDWYVHEGPINEGNLVKYLGLGQPSEGKVHEPIVKYLVMAQKIARKHIGPKRRMVGTPIGYTDGAGPHHEYQKALAAEGYYDVVNGGVNICGDHGYSRNGTKQLIEQFQGTKAIIPAGMPLWITEYGIHYEADYVKRAPELWASYLAAAVTGGVELVCVFRGMPNPKEVRKADPVSVFNAAGGVNASVAAALKLKGAA